MGNRILQVGGGGCDAMSIGANRKGQKNRDRSFFYFVEVRRPCDLLPTGPFPAPCQGQSPQSRCGNKAGGGGCGGSVACGVEVAARAVRCTALTVTQHGGDVYSASATTSTATGTAAAHVSCAGYRSILGVAPHQFGGSALPIGYWLRDGRGTRCRLTSFFFVPPSLIYFPVQSCVCGRSSWRCCRFGHSKPMRHLCAQRAPQ